MSWGDIPPPPPPPNSDWCREAQRLSLTWVEVAGGLGRMVSPSGRPHHLLLSKDGGGRVALVFSGDHPTRVELLMSKMTATIAMSGEAAASRPFDGGATWSYCGDRYAMRIVAVGGVPAVDTMKFGYMER